MDSRAGSFSLTFRAKSKYPVWATMRSSGLRRSATHLYFLSRISSTSTSPNSPSSARSVSETWFVVGTMTPRLALSLIRLRTFSMMCHGSRRSMNAASNSPSSKSEKSWSRRSMVSRFPNLSRFFRAFLWCLSSFSTETTRPYGPTRREKRIVRAPLPVPTSSIRQPRPRFSLKQM